LFFFGLSSLEIFSRQIFNVLHGAWRVAKFRVPEAEKKSLPEIIERLYARRVEKHFGHLPEKMQLINDFVDNALD